jgi:flagellar motor switch protein FliN/FliY
MSQTEQQEEEKNKKTNEASESSSINENEDNENEDKAADDNISWDDAFKEEAESGSGKNDSRDKEIGGADNGRGTVEQKKEAESVDDISWDDAFEEAKAENPQDKDKQDSAESANLNDENKVSDEKEKTKSDSKNKFNVKKVEFASFDVNDKTSEPPKNLEFILDIPLSISVELGRTKMVINDMLQLGQGSVIELDKLAGEPLEVYVNNKLMAKGEVVLVNDKFGVRLTDIISPIERVQKL